MTTTKTSGALALVPLLATLAHPSSDTGVFIDVSSEVGLDFTHVNGMTGQLFFVEIVGSGGALFDYDNDGDLDINLVQGGPLGEKEGTREAPPRDRLYRNELGNDGELRFVDVTEQSGIAAFGYGMGVATGDYNRDGFVDLYVSNYGANQFFRNNGNGTFTDVTSDAGADDSRWGTSVSFVDYDRDGWLDLYVTNYVRYRVEDDVKCYAASTARDYCGPAAFEPEPDLLFKNRRDGSFEDVSAYALVGARAGHGLGVISTDFDDDGWPDLYVANDGSANQMWINQKDGTFRDEALFAGTALNWMGQAEASMGVTTGDFDGDGDADLFMTHLNEETNTLYVNLGDGMFEDRSLVSGLGGSSLPYTAFGTAWLDYDNDGRLDLVVLNGAVRRLKALVAKGDSYPLHEPNQLYRNLGGGLFEETSSAAGEAFSFSEVSRGAAIGDVDNDGDADVLVLNNNGPTRLLLNQVGHRRRWLGLELVGGSPGSRVEAIMKSGPPLVRWSRTDGSFCSANDPRLLFGLQERNDVERLRVRWPSGEVETWDHFHLNAYNRLRQGDGKSDDP